MLSLRKVYVIHDQVLSDPRLTDVVVFMLLGFFRPQYQRKVTCSLRLLRRPHTKCPKSRTNLESSLTSTTIRSRTPKINTDKNLVNSDSAAYARSPRTYPRHVLLCFRHVSKGLWNCASFYRAGKVLRVLPPSDTISLGNEAVCWQAPRHAVSRVQRLHHDRSIMSKEARKARGRRLR